MKLVVLTNDTLHHAWFVRELARHYPIQAVLAETTGVTPSYEVAHPFEKARDQAERERWFDGQDVSISDVAEVRWFETINDVAAVDCLAELAPDAGIVFGTRRLSPAVIEGGGANLLNLHGGDPEQYRGLDTHLWAIWHRDFGNLITALHRVNPQLDDGRLIDMLPVPVAPAMPIAELRAANTEVCVRLARGALAQLSETGVIASRPQRSIGRYYSFMPSALKGQCVERFERYSAALG